MNKMSRREDLVSLMGAGRPRSVSGRKMSEEDQDGMVLERLEIDPGFGEAVIPALLTRPVGQGPWPAVLYCHAHGGSYPLGKGELLQGRDAYLQEPAYGPALAAKGIAALCLDMPAFEERQALSESALAKALLWQGKSLFGLMIDELLAGLDYLESRADLAPGRIAAVGLSMGCTHAWWLAALDDRVRCVASLCCMADIGELIASGAHDRHGIYMTVPGLVGRYETGEVAGLIAPRAHLSTIGALDALTPPQAVEKADRAIREAYETAGVPQNWRLIVEPDSGHKETPRMRREVMDFLAEHL